MKSMIFFGVVALATVVTAFPATDLSNPDQDQPQAPKNRPIIFGGDPAPAAQAKEAPTPEQIQQSVGKVEIRKAIELDEGVGLINQAGGDKQDLNEAAHRHRHYGGGFGGFGGGGYGGYGGHGGGGYGGYGGYGGGGYGGYGGHRGGGYGGYW